jgi:DNA replicative helicase MCM subunit Mcm2 (Cdc46/Mcm family)
MARQTESDRLGDVADVVESIEELDGVTIHEYSTTANDSEYTELELTTTVEHDNSSVADQRESIVRVKRAVEDLQSEHNAGAPMELVVDRATSAGVPEETVRAEIEELRQSGEVYEPQSGHLRVV